MVDPQTPRTPSQRALDVLMDRIDEPWSVGRLARAVGLSSRTLYRVLRRELGAPPMSVLRQARLAQARFRLDAPEPGATVSTVALDCGFTHLGRFASQYKRRFGELPSETLRRAVPGGGTGGEAASSQDARLGTVPIHG